MAKALADAQVNIVAISCSPAGTLCSAQVVVDNINKANKHRQRLRHDAQEREEGGGRARCFQGGRNRWRLIVRQAVRLR